MQPINLSTQYQCEGLYQDDVLCIGFEPMCNQAILSTWYKHEGITEEKMYFIEYPSVKVLNITVILFRFQIIQQLRIVERRLG